MKRITERQLATLDEIIYKTGIVHNFDGEYQGNPIMQELNNLAELLREILTEGK